MKFKEFLSEKTLNKIGLKFNVNDTINTAVLKWDDFLEFADKNNIDINKNLFRIKKETFTWEEYFDKKNQRIVEITYIG